jgi:hypothetical protein
VRPGHQIADLAGGTGGLLKRGLVSRDLGHGRSVGQMVAQQRAEPCEGIEDVVYRGAGR